MKWYIFQQREALEEKIILERIITIIPSSPNFYTCGYT